MHLIRRFIEHPKCRDKEFLQRVCSTFGRMADTEPGWNDEFMKRFQILLRWMGSISERKRIVPLFVQPAPRSIVPPNSNIGRTFEEAHHNRGGLRPRNGKADDSPSMGCSSGYFKRRMVPGKGESSPLLLYFCQGDTAIISNFQISERVKTTFSVSYWLEVAMVSTSTVTLIST